MSPFDSRAARRRRALVLVGSTGLTALVSLAVTFVVVEPQTYVVGWNEDAVTVAKDGRRVDLVLDGRECDRFVLFKIRDSVEQVTITAVVTGERLRRCSEDDRVQRQMSLMLPRPLGDRVLVDGGPR